MCILKGVKIGRTGREILRYKIIQQCRVIVGIVARAVYLEEGAMRLVQRIGKYVM